MPATFAFLLAYIASNAVAALGASVAAQASIAAAAAALGSTAFSISVVVGLSFAASLFGKGQPKPSDTQNLIQSATAPRFRGLGRNKTAGVLAFADAELGWFYRVAAVGSGLIDAIEEHWIDQYVIEIDGSGDVTTARYNLSGIPRVHIEFRLGTDSQTYYADLASHFPTAWGTDYKGNGVPHVYFKLGQVRAEHALDLWPNGVNTQYRQVRRDALVFDPNDVDHDINDITTWEWSENAVQLILNLLIHPDGLNLSTSWIVNAIDDWKTAASISDEDVDLKAGGTEKRYRASGTYNFDERPADVLARFLLACDGLLVPTPEQGLSLKVGKWVAPTVTLDGSAIIGVSNFGRGRDIQSSANIIRSRYTSRLHDYKETDADPWIDDADVTARGALPVQADFMTTPSHSQCRRLMKLAAWRANPNWIGTLTTNLRGMAAIGERFIHVTYPDFGIDEDFEIVGSPEFVLSNEAVVLGLNIQVASISSDAYAWDPATEEGTAPTVPPEITVGNTIPKPTGVTLTMKQASGIPYAELTWTPITDITTESVEAQGSVHSAADWFVVPADIDLSKADSGLLQSGIEYDFQIRAVSVTGRVSDWTTIVSGTAIGDPTAPGVVTNVVATGGAGQVALTWKAPNSGNFAKANVYKATVNIFPGGTPADVEFGAPRALQDWTNTGLSAGTYYYWIKAANGSSVESAFVATGAVTVT
jgi:hypothetical protein